MATISDPGRMQKYSDEPGEAFKVKLRDNKELTIKAAHAWEAIEKYKFACGIIATDNQFDVERVELTDDVKDYPLRPSTVPNLTGFVNVTGREPETRLGVFGV